MSTKVAPQFLVMRSAYNKACELHGKAFVDAMVKALGITIVEDEDAPDGDLVVCARVADTPMPLDAGHSYMDDCADCGAKVWVNKSSPLGPPKVCLPCATGRLERGELDGRQQSDEGTAKEGRTED